MSSKYIVIQTRFLGPTNTRGSRYSAWIVGGATRVTVSADYALGLDDNHAGAARHCLRQASFEGAPEYAAMSDDERGHIYVVPRGAHKEAR
jgi:sRNA-binding protein